ncbi:MAG: helix-hairpin-helix domain-containing protein [Lachnospiraceae bacterium]|nr:helix-hairpin-helix domain-containing protein [Lachnospiraceae bacterium]
MHKSKKGRVIPLLMAAVLFFTGCGAGSTPDIQEILQSTQETEDSESQEGSVSDITQETGTDTDAELDSTADSQLQNTQGSTAADDDETVNTVCVFVCGEVVSPGVYYFADGARKVDAVEAAGGFTDEANTSYVNLAELLTDEMQLYIPAVGEETGVAGTGTAATETEDTHAGKINLNTATATELCQLNGIGESKAQAILLYREEHGDFETVDELTKVSGIGESTLEKIRDYIYVE